MIPICEPHITEDIIKAVIKQLRSGWLGQCETVFKFEKEFAKKFGYKHALAVNSCTSALRLSYALAGVGPNDEVITTPHTFVATNTAICEQFAKPVFADIKYNTGNIDPDSILDKITRRTKAIAIVHYMGYPCDLDKIYAYADSFHIPVIEDCAQAIGAKYKGQFVGNREFGCFSFQVVKQITTGDGGMFVTNDKEIYERALRLSWFGFTKKERSSSAHTGYCNYNIKEAGFKYRMNAIAASMGLAQLPYVDNILKMRREKAKIYTEGLEGVKDLTLFESEANKISSCYMYPIHVKRRHRFLRVMRDRGVEVFIHNFRNDRFTAFGGLKNLPNMARLDEDFACLPIHHKLNIEQLLYIIKAIKRGW